MKTIFVLAAFALGCADATPARADDQSVLDLFKIEKSNDGDVGATTDDYGYPGYGYPGYGYPGYPGYGYPYPWPCPPSDPSWPYPQPPGYCEPPRPNCGDFYRLEDRGSTGTPTCYHYQGRWSELDRRCYAGQGTWADRRFCSP